MAKPLPKWLMNRYALLWKAKKNNQFEYHEARAILNERDDKTLSVILSEFRRYGWMDVTLHPNNARKRIYTLRPLQDILEEIAQ